MFNNKKILKKICMESFAKINSFKFFKMTTKIFFKVIKLYFRNFKWLIISLKIKGLKNYYIIISRNKRWKKVYHSLNVKNRWK